MPSFSPTIKFLKNLSTAEINILAHLLRTNLPPNPLPLPEQWHQNQARFISSLPAALLRPQGLLPRLAKHLGITPEQSILCQTHKPLNPYMIRRIFLQVANESTRHVARLETHPLLPAHLSAFVTRMHSLNSLWMSPDLYRTIFRALPHEPRFERVESECEACILCFVGGHASILADLRSSMLGRRKKGRPVPRLLRLVEAWIEWTAGGHSQALLEESDRLSRDIRECRRQLQLARRQKRRNEVEGILDEQEQQVRISECNEKEKKEEEKKEDWSNTLTKTAAVEDGENAEHDFEISIIREYEERFPRTPPGSPKPSEGDTRSAPQNPLDDDPNPGSLSRPAQSASAQPAALRYLARVPHQTGPTPNRPQRPQRPLLQRPPPPPPPTSGTSESVYHTAPQSQAPSLSPIAETSGYQRPQRPQRPERPRRPPPANGEHEMDGSSVPQRSREFEPYTVQQAESYAAVYRALIRK